MKTIFRFLLIICLLAGSRIASGQTNPKALLLDSVYGYNWVSNSWSLDIKNYLIKNGHGQTVQSLFKKYNPGTGQFLDSARFLYAFSDLSAIPSSITDQIWYSISWNTYQYTSYVAKDIIDTTFFKKWDNQHHKFSFGLRNTYQYNDSLLPVENITQTLDTNMLDWLNNGKTTFSYTASMQPLEEIILSWQNSTSTWENVYKYADVYDGNNLLVSRVGYAWNDTIADWINSERISYYNNPATLPYWVVKEVWNSSLQTWDSVEQSTYFYNQFNWLMTIHSQDYHQNNGTWVDSYLTYYTYFPTGVQQSMTGNVWDTINFNWIANKYQLLDSASQKIAEEYTRNVDSQTFLIKSGIRNLYTYNTTGDTISKVNQQWSVAGNDWLNKTQVLYAYDSHNLLAEKITLDWESSGSAWVNSMKSDYFYSEFIGIDEPAAKAKPCFYANPMEQGKPINCPFLDPSKTYQFDLFSTKGDCIYSETVNGSTSFFINRSLAAGTYILRISENGKTVFRDKVVVIN